MDDQQREEQIRQRAELLREHLVVWSLSESDMALANSFARDVPWLLQRLAHERQRAEGLAGAIRLALSRSKTTGDRYTGYPRLTISLADDEAEAFENALADPRLTATPEETRDE